MPIDEYKLLEDMDIDEEIEEWETVDSGQQTAFLAAMGRGTVQTADLEAGLRELARLADTAGITVLGTYFQKRNKPEMSTLFGKGWLEDISKRMLQSGADLLIVNEELTPMQGRNLEKDYQIRTLDRTELILSIFHNHARTREARLQVKLAELEYQLPRLKKLWGHFDREHGAARSAGGTATRGMGEKQIEIDRRIIKRNIRRIENELELLMKHKLTQRKQRDKVKRLCLVGYTNAGKSTLFNLLTGADVLVEDKLFATLDSTTRQLKLEKGGTIVISDTVGFISNLPHHLVASFRATLMEVLDASLLLHIVDCSGDDFEQYIAAVNTVLQEIQADTLPQLLILNKIDLLDESYLQLLKKRFPAAILISAREQAHLDELLQRIDQILFDAYQCKLLIPYDEGRLVNLLHEKAQVTAEHYCEQGVELEVILNREDKYLFDKYTIT